MWTGGTEIGKVKREKRRMEISDAKLYVVRLDEKRRQDAGATMAIGG
jgi:hypothetical protein